MVRSRFVDDGYLHLDSTVAIVINIFAFQPSVDLGLSFSNEYILPQGWTPGQIFQKCVFWLPLSNEESRRCPVVFAFEIFCILNFRFYLLHT